VSATDPDFQGSSHETEESAQLPLRLLDPARLPDHVDVLYRAAWAMCGTRHDAEDLVQDTFAHVLTRPRLLRSENDVDYLLRALRNTYATHYRKAARQPPTVLVHETDYDSRAETASPFDWRELMAAIAATPAPYRDAVVAVDVVGLSYQQAARHLHTRVATVTSRLSRGRQHVARALTDPAARSRGS
jgi:RNA polymerase sigma-70 factor (ECF subfamily)